MSNSTIWAASPKFRGYEVSRNELVRNIKSKRIIPQRIDPFDKERRARVTVVYREFPIEIFVKEILNNAFGVIKE
jgi:hypothetical protein